MTTRDGQYAARPAGAQRGDFCANPACGRWYAGEPHGYCPACAYLVAAGLPAAAEATGSLLVTPAAAMEALAAAGRPSAPGPRHWELEALDVQQEGARTVLALTFPRAVLTVRLSRRWAEELAEGLTRELQR